MSIDRSSVEHGSWWEGVAYCVAYCVAFAAPFTATFVALHAIDAKRRAARTTTPQVVSTEGKDAGRATGHKIIAFPRKATSWPDAANALEAIEDHILEVMDRLGKLHDLHRGFDSQLSERHFALAQTGLMDAAESVDCLLEQAEQAMEPAQDPEE